MREVKPLSIIYEIPNALPGDVCREAIRRFEEKTEQQNAGRIGGERVEESSVKKTTDVCISGREDWKDIDGHWHVDSVPGELMARQLVALWYMNTVEGPGGETEFALQEASVKPEEGKLVLFPPFWTHIHRAVTMDKGAKYIATTWLCFA